VSSTRLDILIEGNNSPEPIVLEITSRQTEKPLSSLLEENGFSLNMRCGGRGLCSGCRVQLKSGALRHTASGRIVTPAKNNSISACQHSPCPDQNAVIFIPITSRAGHAAQIADEFKTRIPAARAPLFDTPSISAAIDIGTTTVAVLLADTESGGILSRATGMNAQTSMGDNVLTRINHCMTEKTSVVKLQNLILTQTILPLLEQTCVRAQRKLRDISGIVLSGNTVMLHLAAGIDPSPMGTAPFTPVFLEHRTVTAAELNWQEIFAPDMPIHLLPSLSSYVGADINSGIVATGMHFEEGPNLLVDIGTNGEIVLKVGDRLLGCATAAGPAFEGAGLTCGIHAVAGAISKIRIKNQPLAFDVERIPGGRDERCPGICGSAYIDFLGEGVRSGLLTTSGRFNPQFATGDSGIIRNTDGEKNFVLLSTPGKDPGVSISELDVSRLLQAKAAIAAGIQTLLQRGGLEPSDIRKLYLAGGFGLHLNVSNAIACGLLPGFQKEQIEVVGNTSLAGAYLTLQDRGMLEELKRNQGRVEVVELNLDSEFEDRYIENLLLEVDY
jgi:uncharacterized 2Fe-2S/4Fe-4S cluster protein (DUF4445 family)